MLVGGVRTLPMSVSSFLVIGYLNSFFNGAFTLRVFCLPVNQLPISVGHDLHSVSLYSLSSSYLVAFTYTFVFMVGRFVSSLHQR